jgi:hypothetical protein
VRVACVVVCGVGCRAARASAATTALHASMHALLPVPAMPAAGCKGGRPALLPWRCGVQVLGRVLAAGASASGHTAAAIGAPPAAAGPAKRHLPKQVSFSDHTATSTPAAAAAAAAARDCAGGSTRQGPDTTAAAPPSRLPRATCFASDASDATTASDSRCGGVAVWRCGCGRVVVTHTRHMCRCRGPWRLRVVVGGSSSSTQQQQQQQQHTVAGRRGWVSWRCHDLTRPSHAAPHARPRAPSPRPCSARSRWQRAVSLALGAKRCDPFAGRALHRLPLEAATRYRYTAATRRWVTDEGGGGVDCARTRAGAANTHGRQRCLHACVHAPTTTPVHGHVHGHAHRTHPPTHPPTRPCPSAGQDGGPPVCRGRDARVLCVEEAVDLQQCRVQVRGASRGARHARTRGVLRRRACAAPRTLTAACCCAPPACLPARPAARALAGTGKRRQT